MTQELNGTPVDLGSFDLETEADLGATMELLAPRADKALNLTRGQPLGVKFTVLGDDSPRFRQNVRETVDEIQRNLVNEPKDPDTVTKLSAARTAACAVIGWEGDVMLNGERLEFTRDNAARLFYERPWIARQVENFRNDVGNYAPR